jgi:hypothetical protein
MRKPPGIDSKRVDDARIAMEDESTELGHVRASVEWHGRESFAPEFVEQAINMGRARRTLIAAQPTVVAGDMTMPLLLDPPIYESASDAELREWLVSLGEMRADIPETDLRAHDALDRSERETRAELEVRVREAAES